ncbi:MAG: hypothetical protein FWH46_03560 [Methanimicrococcus sp.]|nr:hypothetical protein [Methanimicrococcus sp.]MCL2141937.1 hypothetical protein [Methanimicrococcus sp.]
MMDSDENVKKIARFLENGGTMLAQHCENCNAPLFRFKGDVICPVCSGIEASAPKGAAAVSAEKSKQKSERAEKSVKSEKSEVEKKKVRDVSKPIVSDDNNETLLKELILQKITAVAEDMQNETDSRRIFESLEIIEKGLELINQLS